MIDLPLHPIVVHFPVALAALLPILAVVHLLAFKKGWLPKQSWFVVVGLQILLLIFVLLAKQTGEQDEDLVEKVVGESAIEHHEEWAERLIVVVAVTTVVAVATVVLKFFVPLSWIYVGLTLVTFGFSVQVGHSGGELVYRHGAAEAHRQ